MLVLHEMFLATHRFDELQAHLGIARNVVAAPLRRLVDNGILVKRPYQARPPRFEYHLTRKGVDLHPLVVALQWGDRYLADPTGGLVLLEHTTCGQVTEAVLTCAACGTAITPREMRARPRHLVPPAARQARRSISRARERRPSQGFEAGQPWTDQLHPCSPSPPSPASKG